MLLVLLIAVVIRPNYFDQVFRIAEIWFVLGIGIAALGIGYTQRERTGRGRAVIVFGWIWLIALCLIWLILFFLGWAGFLDRVIM